MGQKVALLILDGSLDDASTALAALSASGYRVMSRRQEEAATVVESLSERERDVLVCELSRADVAADSGSSPEPRGPTVEMSRLLGQIASGLSHDLKNVLNPLQLYLDLAERALNRGDTTKARSSVSEVKQLVRGSIETLDRLRVFSGAADAQLSPIELPALAREAAALARPRLPPPSPRGVELREELGEVALIRGEAPHLLNAIVNLLTNAIDALHAGGTVILRTGTDATTAWVEVADDGPGIPEPILDHVFEPFFRARGGEYGTGLGLSFVHAAVTRSGGTVSLSTRSGQGTRVRLSFPTA